MSAPQITIVGNLVADPELRFTPAGVAVAKFRLASTPRRFDKQTDKWVDGETVFLACQVWRQYAENVAESLSKGDSVIVVGKLSQHSWETNDGQKRTALDVDVDDVGPCLRNASAKVSRVSWDSGGNGRTVPAADPWATDPAPF